MDGSYFNERKAKKKSKLEKKDNKNKETEDDKDKKMGDDKDKKSEFNNWASK